MIKPLIDMQVQCGKSLGVAERKVPRVVSIY